MATSREKRSPPTAEISSHVIAGPVDPWGKCRRFNDQQTPITEPVGTTMKLVATRPGWYKVPGDHWLNVRGVSQIEARTPAEQRQLPAVDIPTPEQLMSDGR